MQTIIVTRHPALVDYLRERGIITDDATVIAQATVDDVHGKHIIGVLPMWLAAEAECVTEIPLAIPAELRGVELTLEQVREFAGEAVTYKVTVVEASS